MKKLLLLCASIIVLLSACNKDKTNPSTPTTPTTTGCKDGDICFTLNGTNISKTAGGYVFADTFVFVKYEDGAKQLSIDIFGQKKGSYKISDARKVDNARIYYFPENNKMYMADKGNLSISELTTDLKITGTFSGTLYKYDSDKFTFDRTDSMVITNGSFTKAQLVNQK